MDPSIIKKLRFSKSLKSTIINAPEGFYKSFCNLTGIKRINRDITGSPDWILVFVSSKAEIEQWAPDVLGACDGASIIWFAYPKKSSSTKTDITRDKGWDFIHNKGWEGVALISIDDTWSAFRARPQRAAPAGTTSDASVKAATGKNWSDWYQQLKNESASRMNHQEIAMMLSKKYCLDGWWSQMVTNSYEQHIGRRKKHQMANGFEASVSKTLPIPVSKAYKAFSDVKIRKRWMKDPGFQISTARENKSLRALWVDGKTRISVDFYPKGDEKCQVVVQHLKLPTSEVCEEMKVYWKGNLERLI